MLRWPRVDKQTCSTVQKNINKPRKRNTVMRINLWIRPIIINIDTAFNKIKYFNRNNHKIYPNWFKIIRWPLFWLQYDILHRNITKKSYGIFSVTGTQIFFSNTKMNSKKYKKSKARKTTLKIALTPEHKLFFRYPKP